MGRRVVAFAAMTFHGHVLIHLFTDGLPGLPTIRMDGILGKLHARPLLALIELLPGIPLVFSRLEQGILECSNRQLRTMLFRPR